MGPLFRPPFQRSTIYDQGALYRMRGKVFVPLDKVSLASHIRNRNWVFVTFGDSGSRKQHCYERGKGGELENPY
jgi:hypothetical protein